MKSYKVRKFPRIVSGCSIMKICGDRKPSGTDCRLVYYLDGKRHRLSVGNLDAAKTEAAAKAAEVSLGRGSINREKSMILGRARDSVRPFGALLNAATIEYADAKIVLGAHSVIEVARFSMRHHGTGVAAKPVAKAEIESPRLKAADAGRSEPSLKDIAYRLRSFAKAFQ
jgi:hypothetical protein